MQISSFDLNEFNELVQNIGLAIHFQSLMFLFLNHKCKNVGHFKNKSRLNAGLFC